MPELDAQPLIISKKPDACSKHELEAFAHLVTQAGEVDQHGLDVRIMRAETLIFLSHAQDLLGVAALKKPGLEYKKSVFRKAKAFALPDSYVFELGWIVVHPSARKQGHSHRLVESSIQLSNDQPIFATSRSDNYPMHQALVKRGFELNGEEYASTRGDYGLVLFTKNVN